MMRNPKYKIGDTVNRLVIIEVLKSRKSPSGCIKRYLKIKCLICNNIRSFSTQTIQNAKSCGCLKYKFKKKSLLSGRKTKLGTSVEINNLISIYKSNAKKRKISFHLSYNEFANMIIDKCYFCGDFGENSLRKKGYAEFKYTGIDRVNNLDGYTQENSVPCCSWCNQSKNKHELDYFISKCLKVANKQKDDKYFEIAKNRIESHKDQDILL